MKATAPTEVLDYGLRDEFALVKKLGSGSYSTVWEAVHKASGKKVAIKKEEYIFDDLIDCKRILREVKLLKQMNHPCIIKLLDFRIHGDLKNFTSVYLVLELAESDLRQLIHSTLNLTERQIKKLLYYILCGIQYLNSAGVMHRDLKPANLLLYSNCTARICDFGLSRTTLDFSCSWNKKTARKKIAKDSHGPEEKKFKFDPDTPGSSPPKKTEEKKDSKATSYELERKLTSHVVTRWYRAPEIILMQKDYGVGVDIWAMGCIFGEMLLLTKAYSVAERKPMLAGGSCYPLSPSGGDAVVSGLSTESTDQLNLILTLLGTPPEADLKFITDPAKVKYLKGLSQKPRMDFTQLFPKTDKVALDLLQKMLEFCPYKRLLVDQCIAHPFFEGFRNKELEILAPDVIKIDFESSKAPLTEDMLRKMFIEEAEYYRKNAKWI